MNGLDGMLTEHEPSISEMNVEETEADLSIHEADNTHDMHTLAFSLAKPQSYYNSVLLETVVARNAPRLLATTRTTHPSLSLSLVSSQAGNWD